MAEWDREQLLEQMVKGTKEGQLPVCDKRNETLTAKRTGGERGPIPHPDLSSAHPR